MRMGFFHYFKIGFFIVFWPPYAMKLFNRIPEAESHQHKKKMEEEINASAQVSEDDIVKFLQRYEEF